MNENIYEVDESDKVVEIDVGDECDESTRPAMLTSLSPSRSSRRQFGIQPGK